MSVEYCNYCGIFHPNAHECQPAPLDDKQFIAALVKAGWTQSEAEQELQSIQEEKEGLE